MQGDQELGAISLLLAPVRWRLYQYIQNAGEAVGRDEAARAAGISRNLAAFHLDRMAEAGLFAVEYRRLTGRSGRGAGRPAKLYRAVAQRVAVSLSATRYPLAGRILATAVSEKVADEDGVAAVRRVAGRVGAELGKKLHERVSADTDRPLGLAEQAVQELGYDPERHRDRLMLRNCPFAELAASHRELICQMNHALLSGLLPALGAAGLSAGPRPSRQPGSCCVTITRAHDG